MSSGTIKAVSSAATALSAAALQPCASAQRLQGAGAAAPEGARFEPVDPPASTCVIAPATAEVRIPMILRREIGLGKISLSAQGAPAGRTVEAAANAVQDSIFIVKDAQTLIDLIQAGVEPNWGRDGVLEYAQMIAEGVQTTPASLLKLTPHDLVEVLHFLATMSDRFTQHVTIAGISNRSSTDVANLMRPIFLAAQQQEKQLLAAREMTPEAAAKLAEILFLYGRKGRYFYALRERAEGWQSGRSELATSILYLEEAAHRFSVLGRGVEAGRIRELLDRIREEHGIRGQPAAWAFREYRAYLLRQRHRLRELAQLGDSLPFRPDIARLYAEGMVAGLSNFAPSLLHMAEKIFSDASFDADAERFRYWKVVALKASRQLNASAASPALRHPAADSDE